MIHAPVWAVAFAAGAAAAIAQTSIDTERRVLDEFTQRVHAYIQVKEAAALTVRPLVVLPDPGEIRQRSEALATVIKSARWGARPGDIFTPEIAHVMRRGVSGGCDGDYAALLALVEEELEAPLPMPTVHGRWPATVPVPTMPPDILAALPPLPQGLQYRFMSRALVLIDIDANLIIDVIPDVIPITTLATDGA